MSSLKEIAFQDLLDKVNAKKTTRPKCLLCKRYTRVSDTASARRHISRHFEQTKECLVCGTTLPFSQKLSDNFRFLQSHYELAPDHSKVCPYQIISKTRCVYNGPEHFEKHRLIGHILWECDQPHNDDDMENDALSSESESSDNEVEEDEEEEDDVGDDSELEEHFLDEHFCVGSSGNGGRGGGGSGDGDGGGDGSGDGGGGGGGGGGEGDNDVCFVSFALLS